MKEALVSTGPHVDIVDSVIPEPGFGEVLIRVMVAGSNPKDWKVSEIYGLERFNSGDDIAGFVHSVGHGVDEFTPGQRVASMHNSKATAGGYAEYAIGPATTTFHIPDSISFEEAATIPLAALTAAVLLHKGLGVPEPFSYNLPTVHQGPLVVYGGASAVGAFAIQLAKRSGFSPIIAVAGRGASMVESLLDVNQGDAIVDYRTGDEAVVTAIKAALRGCPLRYAFDAVTTAGSYINLAKVLESDAADGQTSRLVTALPIPNQDDETHPAAREAGMTRTAVEFTMPSGIKSLCFGVTMLHGQSDRDRDFGFTYSRYLGKGLRDGWLRPHPYQVQQGGLAGLQKALGKLEAGEASGVKYVNRVDETPNFESI